MLPRFAQRKKTGKQFEPEFLSPAAVWENASCEAVGSDYNSGRPGSLEALLLWSRTVAQTAAVCCSEGAGAGFGPRLRSWWRPGWLGIVGL
jgi:hypothetical protein